MKMKCLIVEDEPIAREILRSYIARMDFLELTGEHANAIEAFNFLQSNRVDLLFLDIKMPQMSGLELLKALTFKPRVIITSAYRYYATDAFELDVADYLLKPYSFDRFRKALGKIINEGPASQIVKPSPEKERPFIFVKGNRQLQKVYLDDILYIESQRDYLKFKITGSEEVITRQTIAYYEQFLPAHLFTRIHRSFIVALKKITAIDATRVLIGKQIVPIGRNYKSHLQAHFKNISEPGS